MKETDVIVLDNEEKYSIIKEVTYEGCKYFLSAPVIGDDKINNEKLVIFKLVSEEDGDYVEIIKNNKEVTLLSRVFADAMI